MRIEALTVAISQIYSESELQNTQFMLSELQDLELNEAILVSLLTTALIKKTEKGRAIASSTQGPQMGGGSSTSVTKCHATAVTCTQ